MTTGILSNGVDLASIFGAKGASTAATTGIKVNGTDLNQLLLAKADGTAVTTPTGIEVNGSDLINFFAAPAGALPIQDQTFISNPTQAGGISTAVLQFNCSTSGWSVSGSFSNTSGSLPSGATQISVIPTYVSGSTGVSVTNSLGPGFIAIPSSTQSCILHLSAPQTSPLNAHYSMQIQFKNSAGSVISTTTCEFYETTSGT